MNQIAKAYKNLPYIILKKKYLIPQPPEKPLNLTLKLQKEVRNTGLKSLKEVNTEIKRIK